MTRFVPHYGEWDPINEMDASKHLLILRRGPKAWNEWRQANPHIVPFLAGFGGVRDLDLSGADLSGSMFWRTSFGGVNLARANLAWVTSWEAKFENCDFTGAFIEDARLRFTHFKGGTLSGALMTRLELIGSISNADLSGAHLGASRLTADFDGVRLAGVDLSNADFRNCRLSRVSFVSAALNRTAFIDVSFEGCEDLERVMHLGPSEFTVSTIRNNPDLPAQFWKSAGVDISVVGEIAKSAGGSSYHSCFISYATRDSEIAEDLYAFARSKGVSCWKADQSLAIGEVLREAIFAAIGQHEKLLVIISASSAASHWVEQEVDRAFAKERKLGTPCILPIRIDTTAMTSDKAWIVALRDSRNIRDFTAWNDPTVRGRLQQVLLTALRSGKAE